LLKIYLRCNNHVKTCGGEEGFKPDIEAYDDSYPFGMLVPNRHAIHQNTGRDSRTGNG
jgi:hypothetical protein